MARKDSKTKLNENQKAFCHEYINDWNGSRSYKAAYPNCKSDGTARSNSRKLLTKTHIRDYIEEIKENIEEECGVSKIWAINKLKTIAEGSLDGLLDGWVSRKAYDSLTKKQRDSIKEITQSFDKQGNEIVCIKLHDTKGAIIEIGKLLNWYSPQKIDVTSNGESLKPTVDATLLGENTRKEILKAMQPKED